ncbi:YdcF family protein [Bacillus sp. FJAT-29790]|uniref:YdcF family protein n=1 Tax=Bacillus sp. FJAT-29790 TaxID=1895002 RepID=UPI001C23D580|nr:YdcF family protein [Bacillus sp. FJAT-29790]MBU8878780.1 YdcF family protein [Bacillus sp. FJAT-29790]
MKKFIFWGAVILIPFIIITSLHAEMMRTARKSPPSDIPYLIVLGAKVNGEEMSLSLLYRARKALEYLEENPDTVVIVTGGQGKGEDITEAEALKRFFLENGMNENRILKEDLSTSTYENLTFTKDLYEIDQAVIVSNDFHLYRSIKLAQKVGIKGYPLAAETPRVVKTSLFIREYAAILKMKLLGS